MLQYVATVPGTGRTRARADRAGGAGRSGPGVGRRSPGGRGWPAPVSSPRRGGDRAGPECRAAGRGRQQGVDLGGTRSSWTRRRTWERGRRRAPPASPGTSAVVADRSQADAEVAAFSA